MMAISVYEKVSYEHLQYYNPNLLFACRKESTIISLLSCLHIRGIVESSSYSAWLYNYCATECQSLVDVSLY